MLKQHSKFFQHLMLLGDLVVIASCWLVAYAIRFYAFGPEPSESIPPLRPYLWMLAPVLLIWAAAFRVFDLYRPRRISTKSREVWDITKASTISVLILMAVSFLYRDFSFSRLVVVIFWITSTASLSLIRGLSRQILRVSRRRNFNLRHALVIGTGETAEKLTEVLQSHLEVGVRIIGLLGEKDSLVRHPVAGVPVLGLYEDLAKVMAQRTVDMVFIALPLESSHRMEQVLADIGDSPVDIKVIPDFYRYATLRGSVEEFEGVPIISLQDTPLHGWDLVRKRSFDIVGAFVALLLASPLMLLIGCLIKLTSPGPVFYRQMRTGLDGKSFLMLKFRTMCLDAEDETGPVWAHAEDERRTSVGSLLRRTSLDELPQFWNVLRGEMSIVGPRPERPEFIVQFRERLPQYMLRHKMKAGMTGWAQVNGWRGNTSIEKRLEYDLYYIEHWSLWFDIKIMLLTVWKGFIHRHAY